jgi:hypothetical protein
MFFGQVRAAELALLNPQVARKLRIVAANLLDEACPDSFDLTMFSERVGCELTVAISIANPR